MKNDIPNFESIALEVDRIIDQHLSTLQFIPEDKFYFKPSPTKWSKKEILGHLVDSAQNNIRRFIVAQYENKPKITYNQDKWVAISNYQHYNSKDLVELWRLINQHICYILRNTSEEMAERESESEAVHTIEWL